MAKQLWNVYYEMKHYKNGSGDHYEGTTNNIRLWIHDHNLDRISDQISMDARFVYDKLGMGGKEYASDMEEAWAMELMQSFGYDDDQAEEIADQMVCVVEPEHNFRFEEVSIQEYTDKQIEIDKAING